MKLQLPLQMVLRCRIIFCVYGKRSSYKHSKKNVDPASKSGQFKKWIFLGIVFSATWGGRLSRGDEYSAFKTKAILCNVVIPYVFPPFPYFCKTLVWFLYFCDWYKTITAIETLVWFFRNFGGYFEFQELVWLLIIVDRGLFWSRKDWYKVTKTTNFENIKNWYKTIKL